MADRRGSGSTTAVTLTLDLAGWPGHLAGQHVDVRLTAGDGYSTQRSYSIASIPSGRGLDLTVQRTPGGKCRPTSWTSSWSGTQLELRGPGGGWFVWKQQQITLAMLARAFLGQATMR